MFKLAIEVCFENHFGLIDIFTLNAPILTNEVSMFKLAIEVCFENHFGFSFVSCIILLRMYSRKV